MNHFLRSRKKRSSLSKLRKGDIKLFAKKTKENNGESFYNLNEEDLIKNRMAIMGGYSRNSIEILSTDNFNIYNEDYNDNDESEKNDHHKNFQVRKSKNKEKNDDLFFNNKNNTIKNNTNDSKDDYGNNNNYDEEDIKNKSKISVSKKEKEKEKLINNINNKKSNKEKHIKSIKRKKTKYNNFNEELEEYDDYSPGFNIKIFYEGKGTSIQISKEEIFSKCILLIQKKLMPFYKFSDYDILYKLKKLDPEILAEEKLKDIIENSDNSPTFYLRKNAKRNINNKDTMVSIENFPSFTDLATELNKFFEKEKRESNFSVDFKDSLCKVSFSDSEKAFSLIIFLTKLKKNNPIFKRLKITMDYKLNAVIDVKKLRQKPIKLILPLINMNNSNKTINNNRNDLDKKLIKINTEKNINHKFKSRNDNNLNYNYHFNSMGNKNKRIYDSYLFIGDKGIMSSESKLIKNKIKKYNYSPLEKEDYIQNLKKRNTIVTNYILESKKNMIHNSDNNASLSEESESKKPRLQRLKSTNYIIDLSKVKKKNTPKNSIIKNDDDNVKCLSPNIRPIEKSNFYNLFINNAAKRYKDHVKDKNNIKDSILKIKLI